LLGQVLGEFADGTSRLRIFCANAFLGGEHLSRTRRAAVARTPDAHRRLLTQSIARESAALFNSVIRAAPPTSPGLPRGALRFILSLRATGEGHISSSPSRTGTVSAQQRITPHAACRLRRAGARAQPRYDKGLFAHKLQEAGVQNDFCRRVLDQLHEDFTPEGIAPGSPCPLPDGGILPIANGDAPRRAASWLLADRINEVNFAPESRVFASAILFPTAPSQSNGIEDARFVRFLNDDGSFTYYATYTAYDGRSHCRNCWRRRTSSIQIQHAQRPRRAEQRHGAVPA